ncbi:MAG: response regulator transcription factor [Bacilli bacterium]|nr:response regulator transcription factor [Bacilli bacterium]
MNISICDDEENVLLSIKSLLKDVVGSDVNINIFKNERELKKTLNDIDILFMDIKLKDKNGIDFIKENKELLKNTKLIYITGYDEYIEDIFETDPIYLLKKPITKEKLEKVFNKIKRQNDIDDKIISLKIGKEVNNIKVKDIIYIESYGRTITLYLADESKVTSYNKISSILEILPENFIKIHKSYVINVSKVKKYKKYEVILENDKILPISRLNADNVKKVMLRYIKN